MRWFFFEWVYIHCSQQRHILERFSRAGPRGRGREWATLGVHPLSWLLSNNRLEEVCGTLTTGTFSSRLLLSNQDKVCTPSVVHSLPLPLGPALLNLWNMCCACIALTRAITGPWFVLSSMGTIHGLELHTLSIYTCRSSNPEKLISTKSYFWTDLCSPPCLNGGTCVAMDTCLCTKEFTGTNCADGNKSMFYFIKNTILKIYSFFL